MIKKSFKVYGISVEVEGTEDDLVPILDEFVTLLKRTYKMMRKMKKMLIIQKFKNKIILN